MKKKEIADILNPYWVEYLEKNGKFERSLQFKKFIKENERLSRFSILKIFYARDYISFIVSQYVFRKKFWDLSEVIAKLKREELILSRLKIESRDILVISDIDDIVKKVKIFRSTFKKLLKEYFKNTFGAPDREIRLSCFYEILKFSIKNKPT